MQHFIASLHPCRQLRFFSKDPTHSAPAVIEVIIRSLAYFSSDVSISSKARFNTEYAIADTLKQSACDDWADNQNCKTPEAHRLKKALNKAIRSCNEAVTKPKNLEAEKYTYSLCILIGSIRL